MKPNAAYLVSSSGEILFRSLWAADYGALHLALEDAADGKALRRTQSTRLFGPVVRAMGMVREVMRRGGPQAQRDLWRAAFPMALTGLIATWFGTLSPDRRGIAAVLTLTIGVIAVLGLLSAVVLG